MRKLAIQQAVTRTTVTVVYEQLAAKGYIETSIGRAPCVAAFLSKKLNPTQNRHNSASLQEPKLSAYGMRIRHFDFPIAPIESTADSVVYFLYGAQSQADFPNLAWRKAYDRALLQRHA